MLCLVTEDRGRASGGATLQSCLQEFFQQEGITWECPGEKQARKALRRCSQGADRGPPATPGARQEGLHAPHHSVSFSGEALFCTFLA